MSGTNNLIEALKVVLTSGLAWAVIMGYWPMDLQQQALTLTFGISIINLGGLLLQAQRVTPLSNPKAADGEELIRASGSMRSPAEKKK